MSKVRTVYAVVSGDYSDYSVWCLFETEADAEAYCSAWLTAERKRQLQRHPDEPVYIYERPEVQDFQLWDGVPIIRVVDDGYELEPVES